MKIEFSSRKLIIDAKTKDIESYHKISITFQVSRSVTLSKLGGVLELILKSTFKMSFSFSRCLLVICI